MNTKTRVGVSLGAVFVAALAVAWFSSSQTREAEAALSALARKRVIAAEATRRAEDGFAAARENVVSLRDSLATLQKAKRAIESAAQKPAPAKQPWIPERLQKEPAFQLLWLADHRAALAGSYGPLFQKLGLSAAQVSKFQESALRLAEQTMDIDALKRSKGINDTDPAVIRLQTEAKAEYAAAQRELLGTDGYRQLQEYDRTKSVREMVNGIAGGAVVIARAPLSAQQTEQLVQAIGTASSGNREDGSVNTDTVDWAMVDGRAKEILSETQFAFYLTMEPPLPMGGRFQSRLYGAVHRANEADKVDGSPGAKPPVDLKK
jgi:hypothetical protein